MNKERLKLYTEEGRYLPDPLKDLKEMKNVFQCIEDYIVENRKKDPNITDEGCINWCDAQIYTIDIFLNFMAQHGYTLQKSEEKLDFYSLEKTLKQWADNCKKHINRSTKI